MKKTLALVLACLMVLSAVSVMAFTVSAETVSLTGTKYAAGMENWSGATQLLYGVVYDDVVNEAAVKAIYDAKDSYTWTLTISTNADMSEAVTKVMTPSSAIGNLGSFYGIRFTPCLAEGENQWIPVKDTVYYINLTVAGDDVVYEVTGHAEGYKLPDVDPIVPAEGPADITIAPYESGDIKGWENWSNQTQLLIRVNDSAVDYSENTWKITLKTGDTSKTITMVPTTAIPNWLYRFETCLAKGANQFIPVNGTDYTVSVEIFDGEELVAKSGEVAGFIPFQEPIVPEKTKYELAGDKWANGMENWENSPNKGDLGSATQILLGMVPTEEANADTLKALWNARADYTWTLKISTNADMSDAVTKVMQPATFLGHYTNVYFRFEPCLAEGDNQWIPTKDTVYFIELTVEGTDVVYHVASQADGFKLEGVDPVVPAPVVPDEPDEPQGPTYKVNGTVLTVLADVVGEGAGEDRVFPWSDIKDTITKVVVAKGVTKIDQRAFTKFANLEEVVIADTVTEIGADAFSYNAKLTTLTIPTSVTTIGQGIVYSCSGITTVYGGWESADAFKAVWSVKNYNTAFENAELKTYEDYTLVDGVLTLYKDIEAATEDAYPWAADKDSIKKIIIWDTVSVVGARAFSNCKNLEEVVVGNGVLVLKQDAFSYCSKLATITIPSTVGEIGQGIVYSSTGITTVYGGWETAEEFKAIWSVKNYNTAFEGEGVEYLVIGTVKEPVVTPPDGGDQKPGDNDQKPGDNDQKPGDDDQKPGTDDEQTGDTTTDTEEGGFPTWAIAVIVIAVVAVAAGVVVVLKKKKD